MSGGGGRELLSVCTKISARQDESNALGADGCRQMFCIIAPSRQNKVGRHIREPRLHPSARLHLSSLDPSGSPAADFRSTRFAEPVLCPIGPHSSARRLDTFSHPDRPVRLVAQVTQRSGRPVLVRLLSCGRPGACTSLHRACPTGGPEARACGGPPPIPSGRTPHATPAQSAPTIGRIFSNHCSTKGR